LHTSIVAHSWIDCSSERALAAFCARAEVDAPNAGAGSAPNAGADRSTTSAAREAWIGRGKAILRTIALAGVRARWWEFTM
jgi:hypothetical protein